jgi:hypothetical protein
LRNEEPAAGRIKVAADHGILEIIRIESHRGGGPVQLGVLQDRRPKHVTSSSYNPSEPVTSSSVSAQLYFVTANEPKRYRIPALVVQHIDPGGIQLTDARSNETAVVRLLTG